MPYPSFSNPTATFAREKSPEAWLVKNHWMRHLY
jgi:hypothetical protein